MSFPSLLSAIASIHRISQLALISSILLLATVGGPTQAQTFTEHVISDTSQGGWEVHVTDIDNNGTLDVLSAPTDSTIAIYKNDGSENFTAQRLHVVTDTTAEVESIYPVDMEGNGTMDLLSAELEVGRISLYRNDGSEAFDRQIIKNTKAPFAGATEVYATDAYGNFRPDILASFNGPNLIAWYKNNGDGTFTETVVSDTSTGVHSVLATDMDTDGDLDVLAALSGDNEVSWYENAGNGNYTLEHEIDETAEGAKDAITIDIDGDSDPDVVSASWWNHTIALYKNEGGGTFSAKQTVSDSAKNALSVYAGDVNQDGHIDILSASAEDGKIALYKNDGSETFTEQVVSNSSEGANTVYSADLDGDGDLDVLSASWGPEDGPGTVAWYETNLAPTARDTTFEVSEDSVLSVQGAGLMSNDHDPDDDNLTATQISSPSVGTISSFTTRGSFTYVPPAEIDTMRLGESKTVSFQYTVNDGNGLADTARVSIRIHAGPLSSPSGLRATAGNHQSDLQWRPSPDSEVRGYLIYRASSTNDGRGSPHSSLLGSTDSRLSTTYAASNLPNRRASYFFVTAVGPNGQESPPDTSGVLPRPPQIALDGAVSFGSPTKTTGYRMAGLPGRSAGVSVDSTLSGKYGSDWTAFAVPGIIRTDEMVSYRKSSSSFSFKKGGGFWVLSSTDWTPSGTVPAPSLSGTLLGTPKIGTSIPLPEGWAIITSPYPKPVEWNRVVNASAGFDGTLWGYDGRFAPRSSLRPYVGYYVFNDPSTPVDSLRIPYPAGPETTTDQQTDKSAAPASEPPIPETSLQLQATVDGTESAGAGLQPSRIEMRVGPETTEARDGLDQFLPPSLKTDGSLRMALRSRSVSTAYPWLRREARPLGPDRITTFTVQLEAPSDRSARLSLLNERLGEQGAYLFDRETEHVYDLQSDPPTLELSGKSGARAQRTIEIWVGAPEQLQTRRAAKQPTELGLRAPFPNPTSGSTLLQYTIPNANAPARVRLRLYDVLGRRVQTLVNREKPAGRHSIRWEGTDAQGRSLASGVYFCRFIANGRIVQTRKITLVR